MSNNRYYKGPPRTDEDSKYYTTQRNCETGSYEYKRIRICGICKVNDITSRGKDYDNCTGCDNNIEREIICQILFRRRLYEHMMEVHPIIYCLSLGLYTCSENCYWKIYRIY